MKRVFSFIFMLCLALYLLPAAWTVQAEETGISESTATAGMLSTLSSDSETHPLPDGESGSRSIDGAQSVGGSELHPVEKVFQVFSMVILFGGLALVPLYFLLNARRKKIIRSFSEKDKETDESDTPES